MGRPFNLKAVGVEGGGCLFFLFGKTFSLGKFDGEKISAAFEAGKNPSTPPSPLLIKWMSPQTWVQINLNNTFFKNQVLV